MNGGRGFAKRPGNEYSAYLAGMKDCPAKHYIMGRLCPQINWYDQKSRRNRFGYMAVMIFSVAMSALIPVITLAPAINSQMDLLVYRLIITAFGWSVTAISSINAFCRFRELWIQYRTQCERLKSTLHQFFMGCGEFKNSPQPQKLLVELCEGHMMKETGAWASRIFGGGQVPSTGS